MYYNVIKSCSKYVETILNTLNDAFTSAEELRHIDDERFQVIIEVSRKRITNVWLVFTVLLIFWASLLIILIVITFQGSNSTYLKISSVEGKS